MVAQISRKNVDPGSTDEIDGGGSWPSKRSSSGVVWVGVTMIAIRAIRAWAATGENRTVNVINGIKRPVM